MNGGAWRRGTILGLGTLSLGASGVLAPAAVASNTIDGDVKVSNTETVQVAMDASGRIHAQRIYEQLVLSGDGAVDIANPVSTKGLRNLDGFGGYEVSNGSAHIKTSVNGTKKYRSVSDFTKKLPLDIKIVYTLNGKKTSPADVVGKSGTLEVRYVVTNVTGTNEEVTFRNGEGKDVTASQDVVIPMVGTLETTLPSNFTKVVPDGANPAGDGRGGTLLSYTMTLIPPIGKATAEFGYTAQVKGATIPKADVSALPVNPLENVSFKGGAESYKGGAESGQDLTAGATEIDANLLKIRDGANDLVAGLLKLQTGASQLSAGLNDDAAPGAKKLADGSDKLDAGARKLEDGTGELSVGAGKLETGAGDLSDGLETASTGAPALLDGVAQLTAGAKQVDDGLATLNGLTVPGLNTISGGATALIAAVNGPLSTNVDNIANYADAASAAVTNSPTMSAGEKGPILQALGGAKQTAQGVKAALKNTTPDSGFMYGLVAIQGGADQIAGGIDAQTSAAAQANAGTLRNGLAQLIGGLGQLSSKGGELVDGLDKLAAGASQLRGGTTELKTGAGKLDDGAGQLTDGTGQLSDGAGELASGLSTAAAGSGQLAAGLDQAAAGAPALPEGAERLSKEGTSQIIKSGDETASDFGLRYALLEAGAKRSTTAQPYGSPDGALALTAYTFEIAGEDGASSANLRRGLAALVLLAGVGVFATLRRRRVI